MFFNTLELSTQAQAFLLSLVQDQSVHQVLNHLVIQVFQTVNVEVFDALVSVELISSVLSIANLAHDFHFWTINFNMVIELCSCTVLEFRKVANITTKFGAVVLSMGLQLSQSLPI